jgi:hypothetical protein
MDIQEFYYLIFQANPKRDMVYCWIDGRTAKYTMVRPKFLDWVNGRSPKLLSKAIDACNTYTFFMWNAVDGNILHLTPAPNPAEERTSYRDPIMTHILNKKKGIDTIPRLDKKETFEDSLMYMGFAPPSDDSVQNLKVTLIKDQRPSTFKAWIKRNIFRNQ